MTSARHIVLVFFWPRSSCLVSARAQRGPSRCIPTRSLASAPERFLVDRSASQRWRPPFLAAELSPFYVRAADGVVRVLSEIGCLDFSRLLADRELGGVENASYYAC